MQNKKTLPTPLCAGDIVIYVILILCLFLSVLPLLTSAYFEADTPQVKITYGDEIIYHPLSQDTTLTVINNGYSAHIEIKDNSVAVISCDCPDRVCVTTPPLTNKGGAIACVPADILITVTNEDGEEGDADVIIG